MKRKNYFSPEKLIKTT